MKLLLCLSWLAVVPGLYAQAPSAQAPEKKSEAKVSPRFKELAEDAFDALDRLRGYFVFTDMKLELGTGYPEALRLCDKVRRVAKTADEKKVVDALDNFEKPLILLRTPEGDEVISATDEKISALKVEEADQENKQLEAQAYGSHDMVPFIQKRGEIKIEIAKQEVIRARRILEIKKHARSDADLARAVAKKLVDGLE